MIGFDACTFCEHSRKEKVDGWRSTCDAFPEGKPLDFDLASALKNKECNNGIKYTPDESAAKWGMDNLEGK